MTPFIHKPLFCPRPSCRYYDRRRAASEDWFQSFGVFHTKCRGTIQRFRCIACHKTCSTQTFSIHYWTHSTWDFGALLFEVCSCTGLRQLARRLNYSFRVVQNRIRHLSRNCLALLDATLENLVLREDLTMDGFESFTRSQYFPNNITTTVTGESDYILGAIHTLMRRKGSMKPRQKKLRALIDQHWRPRHGALQDDCRVLLQDHAPLIDRSTHEWPLTFWTDQHRSYPPALRRVPQLKRALDEGRLVHRTVNSRAARTRQNPLFAVNYVDRQIRKNMGEHVRETVKQGREVNCQMERMAIFMVDHNYLNPHRAEDGVDLFALPTHADYAGVQTQPYRRMLERLFTHRYIWGHTSCKLEWQRKIWKHLYENPPAVDYETGEVSGTCMGIPAGKLAAHFRV